MKVEAMIHSQNDIRECEIVDKVGDNQYIAEYRGIRCTAIFNPFTGLYYVDDIYGIVGDGK
jgi:hypothetical protein